MAITEITVHRIFTKKRLKEIANAVMVKKIKKIRSGKVISQKYKPSTIYKRRQAKLQTAHIDLTGGTTYSKLDSD